MRMKIRHEMVKEGTPSVSSTWPWIRGDARVYTDTQSSIVGLVLNEMLRERDC